MFPACFCLPPPATVSWRLTRSAPRRRVAPRAAAETPASEAFARDARELLAGGMTGGARTVMFQDLAKRAPEALDDALRRRNLGGIADFANQLRSDLLPELVNAPKLVDKMRARVRPPTVPANMPQVTLDDVAAEVQNVFAEMPVGLYTPPYETLAVKNGYELRRYNELTVARVPMPSDEASEIGHVAAMGDAFAALADYLFGGNANGAKMPMTTPVFIDKGAAADSMAFVIGDKIMPPPPKDGSNIEVVVLPADAVYAVVSFSGYATLGELARQRTKLSAALQRDELQLVDEEAYKCVVYNGPTTLPFRRKQELLVQVLYDEPQSDVLRADAELLPETD